MADTLFIEWDRGHLIGALGAVRSKSVELTSVIEVSRELDDETPEELGERLGTALRTAGMSATECCVVFPRQSVTLHRLQLPPVPEDEVPDMVRMQAATRMTVAADSVLLDFVPLPRTPQADGLEVLLLTIPRDLLDRANQTCAAAGLAIASTKVTAFATLAMAMQAGLETSSSAELAAVVVVRRDLLEATFANGGQVVYSHGGSSEADAAGVAQALRREMARARMAISEWVGEAPIRRIHVIGSPELTSEIAEVLQARYPGSSCDFQNPDDLISHGELPGELTAAALLPIAGAMLQQKTGTVPEVDFLAPRKAAEKPDHTRAKILGAILAAIVLFGAAYQFRKNKIAEAQDDLAAARTELREVNAILEAGKDDARLFDLTSQWTDRNLDWVAVMADVQHRLPGTDQFYIKTIDFSPSTTREETMGTIKLKGYSVSRIVIQQIGRDLADAGYIVVPPVDEYSPRDQKYPYEVNFDLKITAERAREIMDTSAGLVASPGIPSDAPAS